MNETTPQAGAVPYRHANGRLEVCLVTTMGGRWGFPKGMIDPGETALETALKEAREEAGLDGKILEPPLGSYDYRKWGLDLRPTFFLMQVEQVEEHWEEMEVRERRWASFEEARDLLGRVELTVILERALARIRGERE